MEPCKRASIVAFVGVVALMALPWAAPAQPPGKPPTLPGKLPVPPPCAPPHHMLIQDLDMQPDPVHANQPLKSWIVTLKSDRNGECRSRITVRDGDELAGVGVTGLIRPGSHKYTIPARPGYDFQTKDSCFLVQLDLAGAPQKVDAARTFCAKMHLGAGVGGKGISISWSLKGGSGR